MSSHDSGAEPTPLWQAISFKHNALNAFAEAYELNLLAFRTDQLSCIPSPGMSAQAQAQRKALFQIMVKLVNNERDRKMDRVVKLWTEYRNMEPGE